MINDKKVFPIILTLSLIMAAILVYIQNNIGIYYWDIFLYVNNAMRMAHLGPADTLYLSPFFPAVLSVLFMLGLTGEPTVFSAAAAFYIAGVTGLYLLLRLRFSEMESLAGSISFASFSIILSWAATGALDVPAASLSIWAVYLALLGRRKDPRFYCLALPVAMAAFLTRYTSGLMLLPLAIIIFTDPEFRSKLGELLAGTGLGILLYLPFAYFFYRNVKTPFPFLKQAAGTATGSATSINPGYSLDPLYYLTLPGVHIGPPITGLPPCDKPLNCGAHSRGIYNNRVPAGRDGHFTLE
ncbi:glycosyltransferase family 39 protein [Methanothermobacter wolfeii]|uniref:Glycosyltransferase family 39 protein n=1 Tax=Methanothermobacter wolfeii TaxID=145261 RepID=A0ABU8TTA9_METWO|nr:glycosyltransferase family 39 protein [Methanothermobacter sp. THM-1]